MNLVRSILAGLCLAAFVATSGCGGETGSDSAGGGDLKEIGGDVKVPQGTPSDDGLLAYDLSLPNMH